MGNDAKKLKGRAGTLDVVWPGGLSDSRVIPVSVTVASPLRCGVRIDRFNVSLYNQWMNLEEKKRKLGPKRLRSELERNHSISLSVSVIHKVKLESTRLGVVNSLAGLGIASPCRKIRAR